MRKHGSFNKTKQKGGRKKRTVFGLLQLKISATTEKYVVNHRDHAHLYLSSLNHGAVKSLSCAVRISTICECYKTESLHADRQNMH